MIFFWKEKQFITTHHKMYLTGWPRELAGVKAAHVGDLHEMRFGRRNEKLAAAIREQNPDYIFVTGDFCDRDKEAGEAFLELVEELRGEFPIYACLGNHEIDIKKNNPSYFRNYMAKIKSLGVVALWDENLTLQKNGGRFRLYGLTTKDHGYRAERKSIEKRIGRCPQNMPALCLSHDPKWFPALRDWGAAGVFSGHVHGGLIRLPLLGGVLAPGFKMFPKYFQGKYGIGKSRMYVTAGFGDSILHTRIGDPRELAILAFYPGEEEPEGERTGYEKYHRFRRIMRRICKAGVLLLGVAAVLAVAWLVSQNIY